MPELALEAVWVNRSLQLSRDRPSSTRAVPIVLRPALLALLLVTPIAGADAARAHPVAAVRTLIFCSPRPTAEGADEILGHKCVDSALTAVSRTDHPSPLHVHIADGVVRDEIDGLGSCGGSRGADRPTCG